MKIKLDEFEQSVLILPFCGWFIWAGYRGTIELSNIIIRLYNMWREKQ